MRSISLLAILSLAVLPSVTLAQTDWPNPPPLANFPGPADMLATEAPPGPSTLPAPTEAVPAPPNPYVGDLDSRGRMTGDWGGTRSALAEKGLTFDLFFTQFYQGVASGGREREFEYGGKLDYFSNLDASKLDLGQFGEGLFVDLHAETRYGRDVNNIDGLLAPSNLPMSFPAADREVTSITGLKITQALSENFALFMGKINTLDEYPIRYSPGLENNRPGLGGFLGTALVFNPIVGRTVPYSAAGVGGAYLKDGLPVFSFTVFDPEERATRGVDRLFENGAVLVPDLLLRTNLLGRPGIYNLGGTYSSARYRSIDPAAYLNIPSQLFQAGAMAPEETGSWSLYANGYQALWVDPCDENRNWGVFLGLGLSDGNPNPIRYTASGGVGGRSMIPGRTLDTFGVGYYYLGLSENFKQIAQPLLPQRDEYGVEMFYNYAVTPWCRLTGDFQVARPSTIGLDTAIITGLRLQVLF